MTRRQTTCTSLVLAAAFAALALAGCSGSDGGTQATGTHAAMTQAGSDGARDPADKTAVSTPLAASVHGNGGMTVVGKQSAQQYLYQLMREPAYAKAFTAMDGSAALPRWVRKGGTATPTRMVKVDGQTWLLAQACKPHACPEEQVLLLYDKASGAMQGVFVHDAAPTADGTIGAQAQWHWLGQPDAAAKAWMKGALTSRGRG